MVVKRWGFLLLLLLVIPVLSPEVLGFTSQIKVVTTTPEADVTIKIIIPEDINRRVRNTLEAVTDSEGIAIVDYTTENPYFEMKVSVSKSGITQFRDVAFGPYEDQAEIVIGLPKGIEEETPVVEPSENNATEENVTEEAAELEPNVTLGQEDASADGEITGQAVTGGPTEGISKIFYYILAVVVLGGIIGFVVGRMIRTRKIKMGLIDAVPTKSKVVKEVDADELADAERKLMEAQAQINKLRSRDKIKQAEERLQRDRDELEKLRKGQN
ncbi:hypothetical protein CO038_00320 [Candidatus Pacearchaeota archaeon CG_4_9_14_0_2_um_filter_39_13]|nr:hypothetical protein [Candidatus Pacearchaeota archaeon]OIO44015.1 MAG: hypothetical protein AUJ64_00935 [Candidatus Pacearchaeota archaeon CG1_02_39_14]PJC45119.1 MAG: hypothetical protein CO038_00320 [Candidatus Pacearchaeota archaeon CG_4_9_14_0_2_um_filter_39_13]